MPKLVVTPEKGDEIVHELTGEVVLGRGDDVDLSVPDIKLSRRHGQVSQIRGGWMYADLGSSNGSKVNGVTRKQHALRDGDVIQIGQTKVVFKADPPKQYGKLVRKPARDRLGVRSKKKGD